MSFRATSAARRSPADAAWIAEGISRGSDFMLRWLERRRERHHLASLDDRLLRDIGLTRADAEREYRKPFWRE